MSAKPDQILSLSLQQLFELVRSAPVGLALLDARDDGGQRIVSHGLARMLGYSLQEMSRLRLRSLRHPDDPGLAHLIAELREGRRSDFQAEGRYRHRDGSYRWLLITGAMLRAEDGTPLYLLGHVADVSEQRRRAEELRRSEQLQRTLTSNLPNTTVALVDRQRRVLAVEGDGERMLRHRTAVGEHMSEVRHLAPVQRQRLVKHLDAALAGRRQEYRSLHDGRAFHTTISPLLDERGEPYAAVLVARDVTSEHEANLQLQRLARFDSLTGLPNRESFRERLAAALSHGPGAGEVTVLFLDIDNFKQINDSLGHDSGDELLRLMAARLRACVRDRDEVFRLSGDEFIVMLAGETGIEAIAALAQRIVDSLAAPAVIGGVELFASASVGIARASQVGFDQRELLKAADMAMYAAKRENRSSYRFFARAMAAAAADRLRLSSDLHRAVERGELTLHYQPQVSLASERVVSVEALVRWQHPERGQLPPGKFIAIAEESGLIVPLGAWVLRQACAQLARWRAAGHPRLRLAVNVAAAQLQLGDVTGAVKEALETSGLPPQALELEITESALMNADRVEPVLRALKEIGVSLAIDDFGTGYSSLARLHALPIDMLKIDRAFVAELPGSRDSAAVVASILALARSLGLQTIAEGVQTTAQRDHLAAQGCAMAAGWLWSRALPAEQLSLHLQRDEQLGVSGRRQERRATGAIRG